MREHRHSHVSFLRGQDVPARFCFFRDIWCWKCVRRKTGREGVTHDRESRTLDVTANTIIIDKTLKRTGTKDLTRGVLRGSGLIDPRLALRKGDERGEIGFGVLLAAVANALKQFSKICFPSALVADKMV